MILPPPPCAIICLRHRLQREEQALRVDGELQIPALLSHLDDGSQVEDGGIVDEDVDAAATAGRLRPPSRGCSECLSRPVAPQRALPPSVAASADASSASMSATQTVAPSAANRSAMARPMPRAPPVTTAILPSSLALMTRNRLSFAVEPMDAGGVGRQDDLSSERAS